MTLQDWIQLASALFAGLSAVAAVWAAISSHRSAKESEQTLRESLGARLAAAEAQRDAAKAMNAILGLEQRKEKERQLIQRRAVLRAAIVEGFKGIDELEVSNIGECEGLEPITMDIARALRALPPPTGWFPAGPDDPIIEAVFDSKWPVGT